MIFRLITFSAILFFFVSSQNLYGQLFSDISAYSRVNLSQTHLAGQLGLEKGITTHQSILLSGGLDIFNARNIGLMDVEKGWASMATLGVRHYFNDRRSGLFVEADGAVFFRTYEWRDNIAFANESRGKTYTVTLFPNLNVGYAFEGLNFWDFSPMLGLGYETHLKQSGKDISEGLMPFVGLQVAYWFR